MEEVSGVLGFCSVAVISSVFPDSVAVFRENPVTRTCSASVPFSIYFSV